MSKFADDQWVLHCFAYLKFFSRSLASVSTKSKFASSSLAGCLVFTFFVPGFSWTKPPNTPGVVAIGVGSAQKETHCCRRDVIANSSARNVGLWKMTQCYGTRSSAQPIIIVMSAGQGSQNWQAGPPQPSLSVTRLFQLFRIAFALWDSHRARHMRSQHNTCMLLAMVILPDIQIPI